MEDDVLPDDDRLRLFVLLERVDRKIDTMLLRTDRVERDFSDLENLFNTNNKALSDRVSDIERRLYIFTGGVAVLAFLWPILKNAIVQTL